MAELDNDSENTSSNSSMESAAASNLFIKIKSIPRVAYARDLRLKEGDIILANNGKIFNQDINEFIELCDQAQDSEQQLLISVCRGEVVFDLLVGEKLGVEFDYCDAESSSAASSLFAKHHVGAKDHYCNYEALRDIHRHVVLYDTRYSSVATIAPPIWLMQHRAWEPLDSRVPLMQTIVMFCCSLGCFFNHKPINFRIAVTSTGFQFPFNSSIIAYLLNIISGMSVLCTTSAQRNDRNVVCRQLDFPKCNFDFSHVGPNNLCGP